MRYCPYPERPRSPSSAAFSAADAAYLQDMHNTVVAAAETLHELRAEQQLLREDFHDLPDEIMVLSGQAQDLTRRVHALETGLPASLQALEQRVAALNAAQSVSGDQFSSALTSLFQKLNVSETVQMTQAQLTQAICEALREYPTLADQQETRRVLEKMAAEVQELSRTQALH